MSGPFRGSAALAGGLSRGRLRWNHIALHPDVYLDNAVPRTLAVATAAAALWAPGSVVTGRAAAALHGARWVEVGTPIDLIGPARRTRPGVVIRTERLADDEITRIGELLVTTPARTALDLARFLPRTEALARLDALAAATGLDPQDVVNLAARYPGARGIRKARSIVPLLDAGAQSPRESWLRLLLIDAGFPRPQTQIAVSDGLSTATVDMGWKHLRIGVEYDGEWHQTERRRFVTDIGRHEILRDLDWLVVRVVKEHSRAFIVHRVDNAFRRRGIPNARST